MPKYLGATENHHKIWLKCEYCNHEGFTIIDRHWGTAASLGAVLSFGLSLLCPPYDTHHFCEYCGEHIGTAKLM